ncbi:MAG: GH3 auxin-responsive promoter family protein [Prevotellaceae bacterium]|jgi:hypothetical protein|nr:GH3 auxin-responsive promoter family protein [Prevotellaceae bacterium]
MLNKIALSLYKKRLQSADAFRKNPGAAQQKVFRSLLEAGQQTEYGTKYGFSKIKSIDDYLRQTPVVDYGDLKPYIDRMRAGEKNILWNTAIQWFAKSSGTTAAKSKFIPVSKECLRDCHFSGLRDVTLQYLLRYPNSKLLGGKSLTLGGSHVPDESQSGVKYGDLSAVMIQNTPWYIEPIRVPSRKTALIADFDKKTEEIARQAIKQKIVSFAGVPSWNLVLMKRILDYAGKNNLIELWPDLEVFFHGGVAFGPYREQFQKIIPSEQMRYMETYNASEGFFALQDEPTDSAMLLLADNGVFYEFMPTTELGKAFPKAFTMNEVKTEVNYAVIITTNAGLWRYLIGDTVKFVSLYPHKIKITGRTKHFINVFGEELIVDNAEVALSKACDVTGAVITEYTVAPIFMDAETAKGAHEWLIEFETPPNDYEQFANILDAALCEVNSDYEAKRDRDTTLKRLKLTVLDKGTFYEWMRRRGKIGGQNKVPRMSNSREYAEELIA